MAGRAVLDAASALCKDTLMSLQGAALPLSYLPIMVRRAVVETAYRDLRWSSLSAGVPARNLCDQYIKHYKMCQVLIIKIWWVRMELNHQG
jgi:hypothetical protein